MREIKFRAWCEPITDGEVLLPGYMDYALGHTKYVAVRTETRQPPAYLGFEHITSGQYFLNQTLSEYGGRLMQYTGLKDKNGKEIYQGDLLKISADVEGYGAVSYDGIVEVTAEACGYSLKPIRPTFEEMDEEGKPWDSSSMWHVCEEHSVTGEGTTEVIGNIYDNPDLLETRGKKEEDASK